MSTAKKEEYILNSLENAMQILDLLGLNGSMNINQICTELGFNKSSTYKMLYTLIHSGYVIKLSSSMYSLSYKFIKFSNNILEKTHLSDIVIPILQSLVAEFNETASYSTLTDNYNITYLFSEQGTNILSIKMPIGVPFSPHTAAAGKCILASCDNEILKAALASIKFQKKTENTITSKRDFMNALNHTKTSGFAMDAEENEYGMTCIAVPLVFKEFDTIGSISVSGPTVRMLQKKNDIISQLLKVKDFF